MSSDIPHGDRKDVVSERAGLRTVAESGKILFCTVDIPTCLAPVGNTALNDSDASVSV
ncbi:MAG: hypothetical protein IJV00_03955 [Clostridia bacterium]|nr:hypothetical protein [Clostridia bacterium]